MIRHQDLEIVTLTDNSAVGRGILAEWGLSILVRAGSHTVLLDTGASYTATHNAAVLGIDLRNVEAVVLSHGHWDHTGGLRDVLSAIGRPVPIIAHPAVFEPKYGSGREENAPPHYNGVPFVTEELKRLGADKRLGSGPTWITDDIVASGEEPQRTRFEQVSSKLVLWEGGRERQDTLPDDQSLYLITDLGLVVILGCAHRGMINILEHAREATGTETIYLVLGGTHLIGAEDAQLDETVDAIRRLDVKNIGVSHCTGSKAAIRLATEFGTRFFFNQAGTRLTFPIEAR